MVGPVQLDSLLISKSSIILSTAEGAKRAKICLLFCVLRDLCGEEMRTEFMTIYLPNDRPVHNSALWRRVASPRQLPLLNHRPDGRIGDGEGQVDAAAAAEVGGLSDD